MDKINQQCDSFESEIESVEATIGKKKKLEKDKQERADECRRLLDNHKFHIGRLELLLRLLDNNTVEANKVMLKPCHSVIFLILAMILV